MNLAYAARLLECCRSQATSIRMPAGPAPIRLEDWRNDYAIDRLEAGYRRIPGRVIRPSSFDHPGGFEPPTDAEARRVGALLSTVGTRTLLHTLAKLSQQNEDASLIIAALLDRLPPDEDGPLT